jgi:hypothetical protein
VPSRLCKASVVVLHVINEFRHFTKLGGAVIASGEGRGGERLTRAHELRGL